MRTLTVKNAKQLLLTGENRGNRVFKFISVISVASCENPFCPLSRLGDLCAFARDIPISSFVFFALQ
jgi:hypothetical protein